MKNQRKTNNRIVETGSLYIVATFNNTLVTISDEKGSPIVTGSSGMFGFAGTRKSTPYAATVTTETTLKKAISEYGLKRVIIYVKGIGPGREAALRAIKASVIEVEGIIDVTPIPHNGVRPPKVRRV